MSDKVILDGELWEDVRQAAVRFTGDESLLKSAVPDDEDGREPMPDFYEGIDPTLPKWKRDQLYIERMQEWVSAQRLKALRQFDLKVLIWLAELDEDEQGRAIWQMHQEGIILDPGKVDDMIAEWNTSLTPGTAQPREAEKMSDDRLDRWTQYLHTNRLLLDDPDTLWAEEWPEIE